MAETWVIKDNAPVDEASYVLNRMNVYFTSGGKEFIAVEILNDVAVALGLTYYGSDDKVVQPAFLRYGDGETQFYWNAPVYKTLEFDTAPTGELLAWLTKNADKQSDMEYLTRKSELTLVANTIRTKTGSTAQIPFPDGYVTEIGTLTNTSDATISADVVPEGWVGYGSAGKITGTMPQSTKVSSSHGVSVTKTDNYFTLSGPITSTTPGNSFVYVLPDGQTNAVITPDSEAVAKFGNAVAADVIAGKEFTSSAGFQVSGILTDNTFRIVTLGNTTPSAASGYLTIKGSPAKSMAVGIGTTVQARTALSNLGDATAADVAKGKTFTSAAGLKVTGTAEGSAAADVTFELYNNDFNNLAVVYMSKTDGVMQTTIPIADHTPITTSEGSMVALVNQDFNGITIDLVPDNGVSIAQGWRTENVTLFVAGAETDGMNIDVYIA